MDVQAQQAQAAAMAAAPEDFKCPISLEIMTEPVILWTGQTYDRQSIQRWLEAGHTTCPKTKQELHNDTRLIPNYALRSLIHSWAQANGVELRKQPSSTSMALNSNDRNRNNNNSYYRRQKEAIESLVKRISGNSSGSALQVRDSVRELRILAKESKQSRAFICEAGGVAKLLWLLKFSSFFQAAESNNNSSMIINNNNSSSINSNTINNNNGNSSTNFAQLRAEIEENAVVALLNLSSDDESKVGLVAEGAVDALLHTLSRDYSSPDAKASAALAITSLAMVDVNKAIIGSQVEAIPALTRLLRSGNPRGRKDAAIALYSLCMLLENRYRAVSAGVVAVLLASTLEGEALLPLLDVLSTCPAGRAEMRKKPGVVRALVDIMAGRGSLRSRESSVAVLCAVCSEDWKWCIVAREAGALEHARDMVADADADAAAAAPDARMLRKASSLVQLLSSSSKSLR